MVADPRLADLFTAVEAGYSGRLEAMDKLLTRAGMMDAADRQAVSKDFEGAALGAPVDAGERTLPLLPMAVVPLGGARWFV